MFLLANISLRQLSYLFIGGVGVVNLWQPVQQYNSLTVAARFQHQKRITDLDGVIAELQKKKDKVQNMFLWWWYGTHRYRELHVISSIHLLVGCLNIAKQQFYSCSKISLFANSLIGWCIFGSEWRIFVCLSPYKSLRNQTRCVQEAGGSIDKLERELSERQKVNAKADSDVAHTAEALKVEVKRQKDLTKQQKTVSAAFVLCVSLHYYIKQGAGS